MNASPRPKSTLSPPPPPPPPIPKTPNIVNKTDRTFVKKRGNLGLPFPILFPPITIIPPTCHPKLDSMIRFLEHTNNFDTLSLQKNKEVDTKQNSLAVSSKYSNAYNQTKHAKKKCHEFNKIMKHYIHLSQKEKKKNSLTTNKDHSAHHVINNEIDNKKHLDSTQSKVYPTNGQLASAAKLNYQFCLSKEACPQRMNALMKCWLNTQKVYEQYGGVAALLKTGNLTSDTLCQKERRSVERCSGALVQTAFVSGEDGIGNLQS